MRPRTYHDRVREIAAHSGAIAQHLYHLAGKELNQWDRADFQREAEHLRKLAGKMELLGMEQLNQPPL